MNDSTQQHRHIPLLPGIFLFLQGEWNPQTLPDCCCFQGMGGCSAEFNSDVLQLQRKSTIKLTWKGLLIPTCGCVFWRESVIKGLIFCVPAARFKPSLLVGFCCVPQSRLMFMTYSLALCCIVLALLCRGVNTEIQNLPPYFLYSHLQLLCSFSSLALCSFLVCFWLQRWGAGGGCLSHTVR